MAKTIVMTHDEIVCIIASTYHQYRAETENGSYRTRIKTIHKKLSKFVNIPGDIEIELEEKKHPWVEGMDWAAKKLEEQRVADAEKKS